jgi:hypothetical protein|tara:strand:+ start:140 stop:283 length:144 start_codon:yes stop_codon:yes gene_type:complete
MPFKITKVKSGYKVKNTNTNKVYSKKLMTLQNASKQLKILNKVNYRK